MVETAFRPRQVRVEPGTAVVWSNEGSAGHTVESAVFTPEIATEWSFYSADMPPGRQVSDTFEDPGVYEYVCTVHGREQMCGVVLVGDLRYPVSLPCE